MPISADEPTGRVHRNGLPEFAERSDTLNSIRHIADLLSHFGPHIIDDYYKANSAGVRLALNKLLDQLPDTSTVIAAHRGDVTLETGQIINLVVTECATGPSEEELYFTLEELQLLMRKRFGRPIDPTAPGKSPAALMATSLRFC